MTKDANYYTDLIRTEDFYDATITFFNLCKFRFPTLVYNEKDQCYYSAAPDKSLDGIPYFIRLILNPLEGGTKNDYEATIAAGLFDDLYKRTKWTLEFNIGKVVYRDGIWTNK